MIVFILCCSVSKNEVNDKNLSKKVYMGKKYSLLPMRHMECMRHEIIMFVAKNTN